MRAISNPSPKESKSKRNTYRSELDRGHECPSNQTTIYKRSNIS